MHGKRSAAAAAVTCGINVGRRVCERGSGSPVTVDRRVCSVYVHAGGGGFCARLMRSGTDHDSRR